MTDVLRSSGTTHPRTSKGQATRARIIDAAAALVLVDGVARTSLDDVGAAARVGKSQIYHYFADKSELIGEVVARQTGGVLGAQEPFLANIDSWESWQNWRDSVVRGQVLGNCLGGCPIGSIANEISDNDEDLRLTLVDSFEKWESSFRAAIIRMQRANLIAADRNADTLATAVLVALQGGLLLCKVRKSTAPLEVALDSAIAYLRQ